LDERVNFSFGLCLIVSVSLFETSDKRLSLAGNHGKVVVRELAPLELDLLAYQQPIAFHLIPVHLSLSD
jgi:hypothetical protein